MATILVINGPNEGEWYTLGRRPMVFGRDDALLAQIDDPCVSRRHLEVRYDDIQRAFYAIDLHSRNGLVVNGERVHEFKALLDEDVIQIGHTLLLFTTASFDDSDAAQERIAHYREQHAELIDEMARKAEAYRQKMMGATISNSPTPARS
jgi:pSer/pThr/pTyr-binding forkhead associated (FHA) protein